MSRISTHVLDTARGCPAAGIRVRLWHGDVELGSAVTDDDGRCRNLLPEAAVLKSGVYRIVFEVSGYIPGGFYPEVSVSFNVGEDLDHYHVPLLLSAFGYTTYRGS